MTTKNLFHEDPRACRASDIAALENMLRICASIKSAHLFKDGKIDPGLENEAQRTITQRPNADVSANFVRGAKASCPSKTQTGKVTLSPGATPEP